MMIGSGGAWGFSGYDGVGHSSWFGWVGPAAGLVMLIGLGLLGYYLLKRLPGPSNSALDILQTRLARGETPLEEYEALKRRIVG